MDVGDVIRQMAREGVILDAGALKFTRRLPVYLSAPDSLLVLEWL